jgi:hypothetical protein
MATQHAGTGAKWDTFALANTFALIDIVLHPLFHIWVAIHPQSYEWLMHLFVAGLDVHVEEFDTSLGHVLLGTVVEASIFWTLGVTVAFLYNKLSGNAEG